MQYYTTFNAPLWEIVLVADEFGLTHLHMFTHEGKRQFAFDPQWRRDDDHFAEAKRQLLTYCAGKRTQFTLALHPQGTDFQKKVWQALCNIPHGQTQTYKEIALAVGNPNSARAVGMANSLNPIPIIIPCHRVIGSSGKLTGFAHGLTAKQQLLNLEKSQTHLRLI